MHFRTQRARRSWASTRSELSTEIAALWPERLLTDMAIAPGRHAESEIRQGPGGVERPVFDPMSALVLAALIALQTSPEAPDQTFEVVVPFGCGLSFPVSQSHNTGSHLQYDSWAWDFRMPEGTPIVAAAGGVVRLARGDSTRTACDPSYARHANYIVIEHGNGLETQYLHFSKVVVRPGEGVKAGQLIGYSGVTGWACGAHLHFKVARTEQPGWNNPSVPARIAGYGDPVVGTLVRAPPCKVPEVQIETAVMTPSEKK